jgi:DNA recombination protein RmuC
MFLPTEGLYAEVMRRDALQAEIQSRCHVTIAGPSTLSAILTSFQMGFQMLAIQEKGDEVWKVLEGTKREFNTFETLMSKMETQVGTVQNTIQKLGVRTRAINRTLREVGELDAGAVAANPIGIEESNGIAPLLAASAQEEHE